MFLDLITKRRSIRRFDDQPVQAEKIDLLVEAALRSPASRGLNPWEFVIVSEPALIKKLSQSKPHGAAFLKGAALGIVVCADPQKSDVWIEDASVATIFLHLAAESMGLGSCWIQIRKRQHSESLSSEQYVCKLLQIPENLRVLSILAIGHAAEQKPPHTKSALPYDKVHLNRYGQPWRSR